jgi:Holliday junction resolvasome RuvABC ATP-dependent DNA helicase subunit
MEERIVTGEKTDEDRGSELSLRPRRLSEFIGQNRVKESLSIFIEAARSRGEPLDHVLLYGPPGLGKTTLANIISVEMGVRLRVTSGPAIERAGDLAAILTNLAPGDVLFVDVPRTRKDDARSAHSFGFGSTLIVHLVARAKMAPTAASSGAKIAPTNPADTGI